MVPGSHSVATRNRLHRYVCMNRACAGFQIADLKAGTGPQFFEDEDPISEKDPCPQPIDAFTELNYDQECGRLQ